MKELKSYIFLDITSIALTHFKKSKFLTFSTYCNYYGSSVLEGKIPSGDRNLLTETYYYLKTVYSLTNDEVGDFLLEYLMLEPEKLMAYAKVDIQMKKYYGSL